MRLSGAAAFDRIYATKVFANLGNFVVHGAPNDLGHPRLGFAVPRRVGTAVVRNTIKRRLREALRLMQHDWTEDAAGYDLVLSVRPHEPLSTAEYKPLIGKAMRQMHSQWTRRLNNPKPQA